MISGILFLEKEISIELLYKKYISRIAFCWAVWSAFYATIDYIAYMKSGETSIYYFVLRFLSGHYHLWFLPALLVAYIFQPILQKIVNICSASQIKYLSWVIFVGVIGKETLEPFLSNQAWNNFWSNFTIPVNSVGVIYFLLGYYLYKNKNWLSSNKSLILYVLGVLSMSGINMLCAFISTKHVTIASGYLSVWVLVSSSAFFTFLLQRILKCRINEKWKARFHVISRYTLGIYLVHTLFIEQVYRRIGLTQDKFPVILSIVLFSVMTFVLSFLTTWLIRKIPVLGKWIV